MSALGGGVDSPSLGPRSDHTELKNGPPPEFNPAAEDDYDRLPRWRCDELRRAGYDLKYALLLAVNSEVDLRLALDLPARGCPHQTALRILV